jgi:TolA-binding protein
MAQQPPAAPPQDLKTLQQQLQEAQLKIAALETMIEIAEKQYKIEIRKKPGAKQSPK